MICTRDHATLTTRDVSYTGSTLWRCHECHGIILSSALCEIPAEPMLVLLEGSR